MTVWQTDLFLDSFLTQCTLNLMLLFSSLGVNWWVSILSAEITKCMHAWAGVKSIWHFTLMASYTKMKSCSFTAYSQCPWLDTWFFVPHSNRYCQCECILTPQKVCLWNIWKETKMHIACSVLCICDVCEWEGCRGIINHDERRTVTMQLEEKLFPPLTNKDIFFLTNFCSKE